MGETRVDLHHLLEDLRDAYPGSIEETILTEIVANSLDSGATRIAIAAEPAQATLTVVDDGSGMQRRELARYHDIAASSKTRGQGIGFAGVGIKLGLLVCEDVVTETRRASTHVATRWNLATRHKAPWKWLVPPPGMLAARGTAVRLKLGNALSPLLDAGFIEATLRRHYEPLLDAAFDPILSQHYRHGVRFEVNGAALERLATGDASPSAGAFRRGSADTFAVGAPDASPRAPATAGGAAGMGASARAPLADGSPRAPLAIRLARKHKPSAAGYMVRARAPLPEERRGIAISTFGKVIRRGWDWLGLTPVAPELIGGTVEVPALAECLTLNKGDFIRTGSRGAIYLAYRKAIQEAVSRQLEEWGDVRDQAERARRRVARPLERDLESVLVDLADEFPLLASLVERRAGGQRKLPIGREGAVDARAMVAASLAGGRGEAVGGENGGAASLDAVGARDAPAQVGAESAPESGAAVAVAEADSPSPAGEAEDSGLALPGRGGPRRPARYGLAIQFEARAEDDEIARLVESTVWVNDDHPAYRRAAASRSEGYHIALAVAMALAPLAVEPAEEHRFVTAFLAQWGRALERSPRRGKRRG